MRLSSSDTAASPDVPAFRQLLAECAEQFADAVTGYENEAESLEALAGGTPVDLLHVSLLDRDDIALPDLVAWFDALAPGGTVVVTSTAAGGSPTFAEAKRLVSERYPSVRVALGLSTEALVAQAPVDGAAPTVELLRNFPSAAGDLLDIVTGSVEPFDHLDDESMSPVALRAVTARWIERQQAEREALLSALRAYQDLTTRLSLEASDARSQLAAQIESARLEREHLVTEFLDRLDELSAKVSTSAARFAAQLEQKDRLLEEKDAWSRSTKDAGIRGAGGNRAERHRRHRALELLAAHRAAPPHCPGSPLAGHRAGTKPRRYPGVPLVARTIRSTTTSRSSSSITNGRGRPSSASTRWPGRRATLSTTSSWWTTARAPTSSRCSAQRQRTERLPSGRGRGEPFLQRGQQHRRRLRGGDYMVFLNNDAFVEPGMDRDLGRHHARRPDGRRRRAPCSSTPTGGCRRWAASRSPTGDVVQVGKGAVWGPDHYDTPCPVDYCSAACLLVRRSDFVDGGRVRLRVGARVLRGRRPLPQAVGPAAGRSWSTRRARVVHTESTTTSDPALRLHDISEINRAKFVKKWGPWLEARQTTAPGRADRGAPAESTG